MGGAIASIAAWSIKSKFPSVAVRSFTFGSLSLKKKKLPFYVLSAGQPRTGDTAYADLLEAAVGRENIFRCNHISPYYRALL
jgi:Lipase (class 3)